MHFWARHCDSNSLSDRRSSLLPRYRKLSVAIKLNHKSIESRGEERPLRWSLLRLARSLPGTFLCSSTPKLPFFFGAESSLSTKHNITQIVVVSFLKLCQPDLVSCAMVFPPMSRIAWVSQIKREHSLPALDSSVC